MNGPLLLDTCACMWLMANEYMKDAAVAAIDDCADTGKPMYVSPISAWEVGTMERKGRFRAILPAQLWFEKLRTTPGIRLCDLTAGILIASSFLPGYRYNDPADRIIAATAREYGFTVMTRDRPLLDYAKEGYLSVIEC